MTPISASIAFMAAVRLVKPAAAVFVPVITALPNSECNSFRAAFTSFLFDTLNCVLSVPISKTPSIVAVPSTSKFPTILASVDTSI